MKSRSAVLAIVAGAFAITLGAALPAIAATHVIDQFVPPEEADGGAGWAIDLTNPGGNGVERFVEGPAVAPSGRGSLELTTPTASDRAQIYTNPEGLVPSPWSTLQGASFSTFTFDTVNTLSSLPTMRFAGFQAGATGFTTLSFGARGNGAAVAGQWQTWTLSAESEVFQSNTADGFCTQAVPCTFESFVAQYPSGVWGQMQLGLGSGAPAGAVGYADSASAQHGAEAHSFDFEPPVTSWSTAEVQQGSASESGGEAVVQLTASVDAADPTVFTINTRLPDGTIATQSVEVDAGQSQTVPVAVPFGASTVSVQARGIELATGVVTFVAPGTPTVPPGNGPGPEPPAEVAPEAPGLAASGSGEVTGMLVTGLVGLALGGAITLCARREKEDAPESAGG